MIKWVLTTNMSKKRTLKGDIKTAAGKLSGVANRAAEFLGLVETRPEGAPKPNERGPEVQSRDGQFKTGAVEHFKPGMKSGDAIVQVPEQYAEADKHFEEQGLGFGSEGNITSIRRGVALKGERMARKPAGY